MVLMTFCWYRGFGVVIRDSTIVKIASWCSRNVEIVIFWIIKSISSSVALAGEFCETGDNYDYSWCEWGCCDRYDDDFYDHDYDQCCENEYAFMFKPY